MKRFIDQLATIYHEHSLETQQKACFLFPLLSAGVLIGGLYLGWLTLQKNQIDWPPVYLTLSFSFFFVLAAVLLLIGSFQLSVNLLTLSLFGNILIWFYLAPVEPGLIWKALLLLQLPMLILVLFGLNGRHLIAFAVSSCGIIGFHGYSGLSSRAFPESALGIHLGFSLGWILLFQLHRHIMAITNAQNVAQNIAPESRSMPIENADAGSLQQQKTAETKLQESEKRFQDLVENALMGISIVDGTRFIYMNPEQQRIFAPNADLRKLDDLEVHGDDLKKFHQICKTIGERQPIQEDIELRFYPNEALKQRKELRHVVLRADRLTFQGQSRMLVNMTDITHVKKMEHLALLRSKMASLGHISVGIAHEIRSPLTGINLLAEGLRTRLNRQDSEEELQEVLDQIQKATQKVETVVKRVLDFAKPSEPQVKAGSINSAIQNAVTLSGTLLKKSGVTLKLELPEDLPNLFLDTHLMEQVFLNLISNAVTAMADQERDRIVLITSSRQGRDILVEVSDSGPGISEHLHDRIFDPFFTTRNRGSGIGLSICQRIITDHGGVIHISTSELEGTQFNIQLPIDKRQLKR